MIPRNNLLDLEDLHASRIQAAKQKRSWGIDVDQ